MRGPGIQQFVDEPDTITLFKYVHGTDVSFGLLEKNTEQKQEIFDGYMAARRVGGLPQWFKIARLQKSLRMTLKDLEAALMVDVGGVPGQGLIVSKRNIQITPVSWCYKSCH
jgi:hypothetical protein